MLTRSNLAKRFDRVDRRHQHERHGGHLLGRETGLILQRETGRHAQQLGVSTPGVRADHLEARCAILGHDVPVGRVDRIARNGDDLLTLIPTGHVFSDGRNGSADVGAENMRKIDIGAPRLTRPSPGRR